MGLDQILRICIREDDVYVILRDFYEEPCGGHFAVTRNTKKVLSIGYYWPKLHRDAKEYVRHCDA